MRALEGRYQLTGYSLQEIRSAFNAELNRIQGEEIRVSNEEMTRTDLVNAMFLGFITLAPSERSRLVKEGATAFRDRVTSDSPIPVVVGDDGAVAPERSRPIPSSAVIFEPTPKERKRRKPKRDDSADLPGRVERD